MNINDGKSAPRSRDVSHLDHPDSARLTDEARDRFRKRFGKRPRFGDARDLFLERKIEHNPCTSEGLSTMPRKAS